MGKTNRSSLRRRLRDLPAFFEKRGDVIAAYLFGSYAKGRSGPLSDIDIAALLDREEDAQVGLEERLQLLPGLMQFLGAEDVDLVLLNGCPLSLACAVIADRHLLYESDPDKRVRFEARVIDRYLDFEPFRRVQEAAILKHLKEGTYFDQQNPCH